MYDRWISRLMTIELFKGMDEAELRNILICLSPVIKKYKKNDIIARENESASSIGLVLEGKVIISKETLFGDRSIMAILNEGKIFGEVGVFTHKEWPATVNANTDATILFLKYDNIIGVCKRACTGHRKIIDNTLGVLAKKTYALNKKIEILSMKSIRRKLGVYLLQEYKKTKNLSFKINLNRNELAEYLLVTRPSLSRELVNMQEENILEFEKNKFTILDLELLKDSLR